MSFGGIRALDDVHLEFTEGTWWGLIGPNGSGKSTLLNVLSGVYRASCGQVLLGDRDISNVPSRDRARLGVARTFQHPQLAPSLTVAENVDLGQDLRRRRGFAPVPTVDILAILGLVEHASQLPAAVPYGVRKLAEVARAIAAAPQFLLLDEPAAGLSAEERRELVDALARVRERRPEVSVCLVEHDVSLVSAVVDQVAVLNTGNVLMSGLTRDVFADQRVRDVYLGHSSRRSLTEAKEMGDNE